MSAVHLSKKVSIGADTEDADGMGGMVNEFAEKGEPWGRNEP